MVNSHLVNSVHSSISFSVKIGFKIPNTTFSHKVYLKSRFDWPRFGDDFLNHKWSVVYNSSNPVSEYKKLIT